VKVWARSKSSANRSHVCASLSNSMASACGAMAAILRQCIAWSRHSVGVERMAKQLRRSVWVPKKKPRTQGVAGPLPVPMEWNLRMGDCPSLPCTYVPRAFGTCLWTRSIIPSSSAGRACGLERQTLSSFIRVGEDLSSLLIVARAQNKSGRSDRSLAPIPNKA